MISTDFAPNENLNDALTSLITLFTPWTWKKGKVVFHCIDKLKQMFPFGKITLFLSARAGLFLLLRSLSMPKNTSVAIVGFTCEAVVLPVQAAKLSPLYVDIEKDTFSMDYNDLAKKITPVTKIVILQHTFGLVPKYRDRVLQLAKEKNLFVIEDLAHGFDPVFWQSTRLSDNQALLLSFGRSKALSSVFGGAIITPNHNLSSQLKLIESTLKFPSSILLIKLLCYKPLAVLIKSTYNMMGLGKIIHSISKNMGLLTAEISSKEKGGKYDTYLEKKYPNALAKLLITQLNKYDKMVHQRKRIVKLYIKSFSHLSFRSHKVGEKSSEAYYVPINRDWISHFVRNDMQCMTRFPLLIEKRGATLNDVSKKSIFLGSWYSQPVAPVGLNLARVAYTMGSCPVAEDVCKHIINLPTLISEKKAREIIKLVNVVA